MNVYINVGKLLYLAFKEAAMIGANALGRRILHRTERD